jgi:hypothetical protein
VALAVAASSLALPAAASAEAVPPAQANSDRGAFMEYASPPAQPAAVCIVDSGVDLNPDTQPEVIYRTALDGGDPGDVAPDKHGTLMAMMAAAPVNGWGMVGAAPAAVRIVSVRVESPGQTTFPFSSYRDGMAKCQGLASTYNIKVISLSLTATQQPQGNDIAYLQNRIDSARNYGLDVVAAAGNEDGPIDSPASSPHVVAVGAGDPNHAFCPFSNRGQGLGLVAPGCSLDAADPTTGEPNNGVYQGTSPATAITASVLAALRAYRPDLTVDQAEQLLEQTAQTYYSGNLDATGLFNSAGLGQVVADGQAKLPKPATKSQPPASRLAGPLGHHVPARPRRQYPRPRARVRVRHTHVVVQALNLPAQGSMGVSEIHYTPGDFGGIKTVMLRRTTTRATLTLTLRPTVNRVVVRFIDPRHRIGDSYSLTVNIPRR